MRAVEPCPECGYNYDEVTRAAIPERIRTLGSTYQQRLSDHPPDRLRAYPVATAWSPLEYACHVRDIQEVQRERVQLALAEDQPSFTPMGRDERVVEQRDNDQDPADVATELAVAADALAETLDARRDLDWERTGIYNWPTRQPRTIDWIARHTIHEGQHHLHDIDRLLAAERS